VHAFKHGNISAKDMSDTDALTYAEQNNIPMPPLSGDADNDNDEGDDEANALPEPQVEQAADFQLRPEATAESSSSEEENANVAESKIPKKEAAPRKRKGAADGDVDSKASKKARRVPTDEKPDKKSRKKAVAPV